MQRESSHWEKTLHWQDLHSHQETAVRVICVSQQTQNHRKLLPDRTGKETHENLLPTDEDRERQTQQVRNSVSWEPDPWDQRQLQTTVPQVKSPEHWSRHRTIVPVPRPPQRHEITTERDGSGVQTVLRDLRQQLRADADSETENQTVDSVQATVQSGDRVVSEPVRQESGTDDLLHGVLQVLRWVH